MNQKTAKKLRRIVRQTAKEQELSEVDQYSIITEGPSKGTISLNKCAKGLYRYAKRELKNVT